MPTIFRDPLRDLRLRDLQRPGVGAGVSGDGPAGATACGYRSIVDFIPNHMGLDSAWLNEHPEFFIHQILITTNRLFSDDQLKEKYPGYFPYRTPAYPLNGQRVPKNHSRAYGKDPYFYPWIDTAQLDYAIPPYVKR
jgi:hypothetical protein